MKRILVVALVAMLALGFAFAKEKEYKPAWGGGVGFSMIGDNSGFQLNFEGLIPIYSALHAKITMMNVWAGDWTEVVLSTGFSTHLLYFIPARNVEPYIGGGFQFTSYGDGVDMTTLSLLVGGGAQFKLPGSPIKPYGEAGFGIQSVSIGSSSDSDAMFTIMFGIRFGG